MLLLGSTDNFIKTYKPDMIAIAEQRYLLLRTVRNRIMKLTSLLSSLFEELAKFENGKDPLTNLLNRRFIPTILRREIALAMRTDTSFVVAMLDIEYFKRINDNYGHDAGDAALKNIAAILYEAKQNDRNRAETYHPR